LKWLPNGDRVPHNLGYLTRKEASVTRHSIKELIQAWRPRYLTAQRKEKTQILDELVALTGYHRKAIMRLLRGRSRKQANATRGRPRTYTNEVKAALIGLWEISGKICSKRLAPFLPELIEVLQRVGELSLPVHVKELVTQMSPATMDRLLCTHRPKRKKRGPNSGSGRGLRRRIPVSTSWEWNGTKPGFLELDLVVHCGESAKGEYLHTLNTVDIATSWCELAVLPNRSRQAVKSGLEKIKKWLVFPLLGIDSDNDSAFLNGLLVGYCEQNDISFTRCRPYKKNDQAHIEQKNWTAVRKLIGYDRYASEEALRLLEEVYKDWRLLVNYFQPVRKLTGKERVEGKVRKLYDQAKTPYQRVLASPAVEEEAKERLREIYLTLNPVKLRRQMEENLRALWKVHE